MPVGSGSIIYALSSIIRTAVLSPRNLLLTLALVSLRSHTRSSLLHCKFPLCLLTQHPEAFSSSFSLIVLEQLDHVASTGILAMEQNSHRMHAYHTQQAITQMPEIMRPHAPGTAAVSPCPKMVSMR